MVTRSLPVEIEQVVYAGTDLLRQYRWLPDGVTPQDFTDWTGVMLVGPPKGTATLTLDSETVGSGLTLSADGIISIHLTAVQTAALTAATLIYVLDLTDHDGVTLRFMRGRLVIVRELDPAATP